MAFHFLCRRLVMSSTFDYVSCLAILLYCCNVAVQTQYMCHNPEDDPPSSFQLIEVTFCSIFTMELTMRFAADQWNYLWGPEYKWNIFDILLVGLQIFDLVLDTILNQLDASGGANTSFL